MSYFYRTLRKSERYQIHLNLAATLITAICVFLLGIDLTDSKVCIMILIFVTTLQREIISRSERCCILGKIKCLLLLPSQVTCQIFCQQIRRPYAVKSTIIVILFNQHYTCLILIPITEKITNATGNGIVGKIGHSAYPE